MIKSTELRQGNYVKFEGRIIPVLNITQDTPDCEGVPLTPEILISCGFERTGRYAIGAGGYHTFTKGKIEFLEVKKGYPYTLAFYEAKISYIHQLQNLYFALTGEELTVNFKELTID